MRTHSDFFHLSDLGCMSNLGNEKWEKNKGNECEHKIHKVKKKSTTSRI